MARIYTSYIDSDGVVHFADATVGDDLYYGLSFVDWLAAENDSFVSAAWTLPSGITTSDDYLVGSVAYIKLATPTAGTYEIVCTLSSVEGSNTQTKVQEILLTVV